jgi:hypothetical protein
MGKYHFFYIFGSVKKMLRKINIILTLMKKRQMFMGINSVKLLGLIMLLFLSYSAFAGSNKVSSNYVAVPLTGSSLYQTVATAAGVQAKTQDAKAKTEATQTESRAAYDQIDPEFKGIGPGNNTVPFIIALVVFILATVMGRRKKCKAPKVMMLVALLSLGYIAKITYVEARALGRQQGYAPVQPIWFSHQIHVTQNGIDCEYCHVDARTSRHAGVPSLNVCMNCHSQVKEGSVSGKKEIAKIYEHLGYNPTTMQYDKPAKPIEWVKVHNLPDHVYFNHAQHVQAGKVACQECHGPVEKMNRVVEYKELAMGDFCLDCHRKRGIDTSNPYYKHYKFKELKEKQGIDKITVDKIGGADCSSCHY